MDTGPGFEPYSGLIHSEEVNFQRTINLSALKGKTILITGGASGLGAACARFWAEHGANIMIGDINKNLGTQLVAELRKTTHNDNHHFFSCDVTKWQSQAEFFKQAAKASPHGGLDIVVANAGIADGLEGAMFEEPPDYSKMDNPAEPAITRTIEINLKGVYFTTHLALSYLPRNPGSKPCSTQPNSTSRDRQLILVSSVAGFSAVPKLASYCSAKHGVVGLFRSLRITAPVEHGVRVNMINPYFVKTAILGVGGALALAGADTARIEDVVDIMTRFATDQSIVGRGLVIGIKGTQEETKTVKLPHGGPVWDVYANDFEQTDIFTRRIVGLTNLRANARGLVGMLKDVFMAFASPVMKRLTG